MILFFVLLFTLLVVLASSNSGDQDFYEIVTIFRDTTTPSGLGTSENGW
jgi:hypothetical protein